MLEISTFINDMSGNHKVCYRSWKDLLQDPLYAGECRFRVKSPKINYYHLKTVVLNHSEECTETSEDWRKCAKKIYSDLVDAYETGFLKFLHSGMSLSIYPVANASDLDFVTYFFKGYKVVGNQL